jgi:RNA polymerase-interacting CarD/CdnL/TRCF family regulator
MRKELSPFSTGSLVFDPFLGLCTLRDSRIEKILGTEQRFYELEPKSGRPMVKIPEGQMAARGIRPLMSSAEMSQALHPASEAGTELPAEDSGQRMQRWIGVLKSGIQNGVPEILREIRKMHQKGVKLSPKEVDLQDTVRNSLRQEIGSVLNLTASKAGLRLNQAIEG